MANEFLKNKLEETENSVSKIHPKDKTTEQSDAETTAQYEQKIASAHHWVEDIFAKEQDRLARQGISDAKLWIESMASIDKSLTEHPKETLGFLAQVYGITYPQKSQSGEELNPKIIQCLKNLEQNQKNLWKALDQQRAYTEQFALSNFANAKDDDGKLLHPYFSAVKDEMVALLNSGIVFDLESAYEKALWLNSQTRNDLIEKKETQNLQTLAEEADKAKSAGFSPKGGLEKEDFSKMTTREILEHNYKKLEE